MPTAAASPTVQALLYGRITCLREGAHQFATTTSDHTRSNILDRMEHSASFIRECTCLLHSANQLTDEEASDIIARVDSIVPSF